ncbi:hypothetical protein, partial [Clostridium perfringens]
MFDAKRQIGRRFDDAAAQPDMKHFRFKIIDKGGRLQSHWNPSW